MDYLPIFIDLKGRGCLVVGGGVQAAAKVALLRSAGARVTVLAETLCPELARTLDKGEVLHLARQFRAEDLDGASLVIAATGNARRDRAVARAAAARDIAVNVVDDAQASSFIMPAIIDRSPVVIAVSSGGAAPALTRLLKTRIEGLVPAAYGGLASLAASFRGAVKALIPEAAARRRFWRRALEGTVADAALSGDGAKARERMIALLNAPLPPHDIAGRVAIVGAGPGDPELLTLRALRLVQAADVLVFDRLVGDRVLDYARRDAERIDVGKTKGDAATAQADIDALLVSLARAGKGSSGSRAEIRLFSGAAAKRSRRWRQPGSRPRSFPASRPLSGAPLTQAFHSPTATMRTAASSSPATARAAPSTSTGRRWQGPARRWSSIWGCRRSGPSPAN